MANVLRFGRIKKTDKQFNSEYLKVLLVMVACVVSSTAVCLITGEGDYPKWLVFKIAKFDQVIHLEDGLSSVIEGRTVEGDKFKFKAEWSIGSKAASYVDRWITNPKPGNKAKLRYVIYFFSPCDISFISYNSLMQ